MSDKNDDGKILYLDQDVNAGGGEDSPPAPAQAKKDINDMSDEELIDMILQASDEDESADGDFGEDDEPADTTDENSTVRKRPTRLRDISLPDGVANKVMKQYIVAAIIAIVSLVLTIVEHEASYLIGFAIAGALVYIGISITLDFADNKITELPVVCVSSRTFTGRRVTKVVFRTTEDAPNYFEFYVPGKDKESFEPNYTYIIYFREDKPKELLGYTQI